MLRPLAQLIAGLLGEAQDLRRLLRCVSLGIVQLDPRPVPGGQAEDALGKAVLPLGWDGETRQVLQGDLLALAGVLPGDVNGLALRYYNDEGLGFWTVHRKNFGEIFRDGQKGLLDRVFRVLLVGQNLPGHVEHEPLIPGRQGSKLALFLRALHHGQGQG